MTTLETKSGSEDSETLEYQQLSTTAGGHGENTNPVYYHCPKDRTEYLIIVKKEDLSVIFYDIVQDSFEERFKYPDDIKAGSYSPPRLVLNKENNELYIFSGVNVYILNLSNGEWKYTNRKKKLAGYSKGIRYLAVYSTIYPYFVDNKIHVCYKGKYYTYSKPSDIEKDDTFKFDEINEFDTNERPGSWCYDHKIEHVNINDCDKLLLFGGYYSDSDSEYFDDIQSYDITQDAETREQKSWTKLDVKLPYKEDEDNYFAVIGFDTILFYFNKLERDIFCLDLLITNKWYKSHKQLPIDIANAKPRDIVNTKDNYAHVMGGRWKSIHVKFALYDVIPEELISIYQNNSEPLIMGYIKFWVEQNYNILIPNALKYLICQFYPSLL